MIGLMFLGAGLLWLWLTAYLTIKVPRWLGLKTTATWLLRLLLVPLLVVGPFVDHIIGMRQFQRLCDSETGLHIAAEAANTKKAKGLFSKTESLQGYVIPIERDRRPIIDLDNNQEIAWYYRFRTSGGIVGGMLMLGGKHTCAIDQANHIEHQRYLNFEVQTNFIR